MKRFMHKKGVTPLIATILLIAFAIALGAVVMNWGRSYVESSEAYADKDPCALPLGMSIANVNGKQYFCYDGKDVRFSFENGDVGDIAGIQIIIYGDKDIFASDIPGTATKRGDVTKSAISYNKDVYGRIEQVKLIPKVVKAGTTEEMLCKNSEVVVNVVDVCG